MKHRQPTLSSCRAKEFLRYTEKTLPINTEKSPVLFRYSRNGKNDIVTVYQILSYDFAQHVKPWISVLVVVRAPILLWYSSRIILLFHYGDSQLIVVLHGIMPLTRKI